MARSIGKASAKIQGYCNTRGVICKKSSGRLYMWGPKRLLVKMILTEGSENIWAGGSRQLLIDTKFLKSRTYSSSLKSVRNWAGQRGRKTTELSGFALSDTGPF